MYKIYKEYIKKINIFVALSESTFRRLEEADAGLDLGPVLTLLLRGVFHHQLVELHGDDVMVIWEKKNKTVFFLNKESNKIK